ncbi:MAG TPA: family 1 glycosylhydrolase [Candidatus Ozemobacteraceae bacterium]|nr:family 1 glycosylhydrolase [Candidatus Ozemobacteraceae bacterium]
MSIPVCRRMASCWRFLAVLWIAFCVSAPAFADIRDALDRYSDALRRHLVWQFLSLPTAGSQVERLVRCHTKTVADLIRNQWRQTKASEHLRRSADELERLQTLVLSIFPAPNSGMRDDAARLIIARIPEGAGVFPVRRGYLPLLESLRSRLQHQEAQSERSDTRTLDLVAPAIAKIRAECAQISQAEEVGLLQAWFSRNCVAIEPALSESGSPIFVISGAGTVSKNGNLPGKPLPTGNPIPKKFLWGVSTSSQQWEGKRHGGIWETFADAGRTEEKIGRAANGYELFEKDLDLAAGMGLNAFRTSIEWGRIEPEQGKIDPEGVKFYHRLFDGMRKRGLEPVVTLVHFTWPQWFEKIGGWDSEAGVRAFCRFVDIVSREYGSKVDFWLTYNEPPVEIIAGYVLGASAPGYRNPLKALAVTRAWIRCHKLAYRIIHENDTTAYVSWNNYTGTYRLGSLGDIHVLVEGAANQGGSDASAAGVLETLTSVENQWMKEVASIEGGRGAGSRSRSKYLDYIGIDYYALWRLPGGFTKPHLWEIHPEGFYDVIRNYYNWFRVPVLVAENGMASCDLAPRQDGWTREAFLVQHVKQMQRAIRDGYPVLGYIHWSITDNWEWGSFAPRFGLYSVDCRNERFERVPTPSVDVYRAIVRAGGVTPELEARYPAPISSGKAR